MQDTFTTPALGGPIDPPAPLVEPSEATEVRDQPMVGLEFYTTTKGAHRAKLGAVERVPGGEGEGATVPKVVSPVLVSEMYEESQHLGAELTTVLGEAAYGRLLVIGEVPPGFYFGTVISGLDAEALARDTPGTPPGILVLPTPEHLEGFGGKVIDRRQLGIILALDRKFDHQIGKGDDGGMDPRPRRVLLALEKGDTLPEAVMQANKLSAGGKWGELSDRGALELAREEVYKLALYIVLVQNRDIGPPSSRLG